MAVRGWGPSERLSDQPLIFEGHNFQLTLTGLELGDSGRPCKAGFAVPPTSSLGDAFWRLRFILAAGTLKFVREWR